jgi:hypothetical protein
MKTKFKCLKLKMLTNSPIFKFIISSKLLVLWSAWIFLLIVTSFKNYFLLTKNSWIIWKVVCLLWFFVGMLIVSISREKIEDELTSKFVCNRIIMRLDDGDCLFNFIHLYLSCILSTPNESSGDLSILFFYCLFRSLPLED